jgi:ERCC4-type nuclease
MRIILDQRESKILDVVKTISSEVEERVLPFGDLFLVRNDYAVVLERKTVSDFVSSIRSNRLWEQLLRLLKNRTIFEYPIRRRLLLIHGSIQDYIDELGLENSRASRLWSNLAGAIFETVFVYDTPIIFAENDDALASFLRILIKRESKGLNDELPKSRWYQKVAGKNLPEKEQKLLILDAIPDIGEVLSQNLLDYFGSVANIAHAHLEDFQKVPGIGKKKAELIYRLLH